MIPYFNDQMMMDRLNDARDVQSGIQVGEEDNNTIGSLRVGSNDPNYIQSCMWGRLREISR